MKFFNFWLISLNSRCLLYPIIIGACVWLKLIYHLLVCEYIYKMRMAESETESGISELIRWKFYARINHLLWDKLTFGHTMDLLHSIWLTIRVSTLFIAIFIPFNWGNSAWIHINRLKSLSEEFDSSEIRHAIICRMLSWI